MSVESAQSFIENMELDEEFAKKVTACQDVEERTTVVLEACFDFPDSKAKKVGQVLSEDILAKLFVGMLLNFS